MKKKNLAIILLLAVAFLLCACSGKSDDPQGAVKAEDTAESSAVSGQLITAEPEDSQAVQSENPLSLGRIQGGTYTNEYLGLECKLDDSWEFFSAEELQQMPELVAEALEGSALEEALVDYPQITDIQAECVEDMTGFNIIYRKMSMEEKLWYMGKSDEDVINELLQQQQLMAESYAQAGLIVQEMSSQEVNFLGEQRIALYTYCKVNDLDYYILQIFENNIGTYAATLTFNSFVENNAQQIMDLFYKA